MGARMRFWLIAMALLLSAASPVVERRSEGNLVLENIPPTPAALADRLRSWDDIRTAGFQDWLADNTMLITTRFASTAQVHRVMFAGGARTQVTYFDEPVAQALARPGHPTEFALRRDSGGGEYYQIDLADLGGGDRVITPPGTRNQSLVFSPDGAMLAWSSVPRGTSDYAIWIASPDTPERARVVMHAKGEVDPLAFSPDGKQLLFERVEITSVSQKLFLLDLATGKAVPVAPAGEQIDYDLAFGRPQFTPDGMALILGTNQGSEFKRLVRLNLVDFGMTTLTPAVDWDIEGFSLSADGRMLAYSVNEDGLSKLYVRNLMTGGTRPVAGLPDGALVNLRFSPDGSQLAINMSAASTPLDVWAYTVATRRLDRWTQSELGGVDPKTLVPARLMHYPAVDGRMIPAFVYAPPDTPGRRPVIISIHGGPEGQTRPDFWPANQVWVHELGAVVIAPNIRGSDGYGRTYLSLDNGMKRQDAVRDIGALLDWIARQPGLDANRVVVAGGSYGGFMTLSAFAAYGERLAGAYDIVGISNLVTFLEHTEAYRRDLRRNEYGDERDPAMRDYLERTAPLNNTQKMTKPLFVVAGLNDPRVPYTEAEQLVARVRAQGGDVWYMLAKDEGHGFRRKPNRDAQRDAEILWFQHVFRTAAKEPAGK
jgi:dipeptidyl aminopeptidase/acylaminoacyl peptidase